MIPISFQEQVCTATAADSIDYQAAYALNVGPFLQAIRDIGYILELKSG